MKPSNPRNSSWIRLRSKSDRRLRKATKTIWKPAGTGLALRKDIYEMKPKISKKEAALFERRGIRFAPKYRPYLHKVNGLAREGFLKEPKLVHDVERRRVPGRALKKALKGNLDRSSKTYRRYFR